MKPSSTQAQSYSATTGNKKKLHDAYYRVMINLPVIIKEKDLIDRKRTIDVFKRKAATNQKQPTQKNQTHSKKTANDQIGRIYINELWSDKFHKLVMNESKIQEVLDKISKLYRRNVEDFVDDIHNAALEKTNASNDLINQHINNSSLPYFTKNNSSYLSKEIKQSQEEDTLTEDLEDQSFMNQNKSVSVIKKLDNIKKDSVSLPLKIKDSALDNLQKSIVQKYKRKQKDNSLSQPKYQPFESTVSPTFFNNAQNILQQCKQINEEWEMNRQLQRSNTPFYISKDDRY